MGSMGEMISVRRKALGMTQRELAEKMNVTDKAVSKWERGLAYPDIASISQLAQVLGVTVAELMETQTVEQPQGKGFKEITDLILKAVPLAMGVAVTVLSVLKQIDLYSGFGMLGIGLFCMALRNLQEK